MKILIFLAAFTLSFSTYADELLIERIEAKQGVDTPKKSDNMNQARAQFGDPLVELPAVGSPPITRWEYTDFIVYFEHELVISTVIKRSSSSPKNEPNN